MGTLPFPCAAVLTACLALPDSHPFAGGVLCVTYAVAVGTGISYFQYTDIDSGRNIFIVGFAMFMALLVPRWLSAAPAHLATGSGVFPWVRQGLGHHGMVTPRLRCPGSLGQLTATGSSLSNPWICCSSSCPFPAAGLVSPR